MIYILADNLWIVYGFLALVFIVVFGAIFHTPKK
jgi:hypothetical protein